MKRSLLILTLVAITAAAPLRAQSLCQPMDIQTAQGTHVMTIVPDNDRKSFSLDIGGFLLNLGSRGETTTKTHTQTKTTTVVKTTTPSSSPYCHCYRGAKCNCGNRCLCCRDGYCTCHKTSTKTSIKTTIKRSRAKLPSMNRFQLGFNHFVDPDYSIYPDRLAQRNFLELDHGKSISVSIGILALNAPINRRGTFGFSTGLSLKWDNYVFANKLSVAQRGGMLVPIDTPYQLRNFKKSKMTTFSLSVPLTLVNKFGDVYLSYGLYGSAVLSQHTKIKHPIRKSHADLGINPFHAGVTARLGLRHFYVFANYGLTPYFRDGRGPKTQPLTIGFGF